jgi:hypothetical protein
VFPFVVAPLLPRGAPTAWPIHDDDDRQRTHESVTVEPRLCERRVKR